MGRSENEARASRQSVDEITDHIPANVKLEDKLSNTPLKNGPKNVKSANLLSSSMSPPESAASDTESACSGSNSSSKDNEIVPQNRAGPRGIFVPARVWQETNNRLKSFTLYRSNSLKSTLSTLPLEKNFSSRGMASPSRVRNAVAGTSTCSEPSVLCFAADVCWGKSGDSKISDAHFLRLINNRHLQWRFANSTAEAALSWQKHVAEVWSLVRRFD